MKKILLLFLLLPFIGISQALSGNYIIKSTNAAPFNTLTNAVTRINSVGAAGPVVFLLDDTSYSNTTGETFPIIITQFTGTSATNTLTIKPNIGKTVTITATNRNGFTGVPAVIEFNGADNIIIDGNNATGTTRNLTLINNDAVNFIDRTVLWVASNGANGATNIDIRNTILKSNIRNQQARQLSGIYSGSNELGLNNNININNAATANNATTKITNNEFINVRQGVYINSSATLKTSKTALESNIFGSTINTEKPSLPIYMINTNDFTITNNVINGVLNDNTGNPSISGITIENGSNYNIKRNTISDVILTTNHIIQYAIFISGTQTNGVISENKITNIKNTGNGIIRTLSLQMNATTSANMLVANNFISDITTTGTTTNGASGIQIQSGRNIKLYHNSVVLNGNQNNISAALNINAGTELDIINNIFGNTSTTGTAYSVYSTVAASSFLNIDYNDYYSARHIGFLGGNRTTLANWQTATTKDRNSINVIPTFVSIADLHLSGTNAAFDDKGTPLAIIPTDIDEESRSTVAPDMGADEYNRCKISSTWNGTNWSNGTPTLSIKAIINGTYNTQIHGNITTCELTINTEKTLTITSGKFVEVQNDVTVIGNLIIENNGSLIQNDDDAKSTGIINVIRNSSFMKQYDYTYWSSPVAGIKLSNFKESYLYYSFNDAVDNWQFESENTIMAPGKGYIARAPENDLATQIVSTTFTGVPFTGLIELPIATAETGSLGLIGNPYPSALNADAFLTNANNKDILEGTLYFWTHNTAIAANTPNPGSGVFAYSGDDYASYNLTGSTVTTSPALSGKTNNNNNRPQGNIASGQGFFAEIKETAPATKKLVFNNSMRVKGENGNTQFFKTKAAKGTSNTTLEKNRVWVNITNEQGAYSEMLLGYITGATNGYDNGYDGKTFSSDSFVSMYSILGEENLSIQGRSLPFDEEDSIPLGFENTIGGTFSVGIDSFDGFFTNQEVFLHDKKNDATVNLKQGRYTFTTEKGTFNDRFELKFKDKTLGVENPELVQNGIVVFKNGSQIQLVSEEKNIQDITIYNILGKSIYQKKNINTLEHTTNGIQTQKQLVIVKIKTEDGLEITKKMML
ncbi:T9SS sorting signal type C domain-containing protein [Flavobacterium sp. 11]|uniref:T9SS sorting signal type C domain-containing protein n=1 Tax=Flavobacterium sp. 11 TaxID=357523 RepID=UPI000C19B425|nr:T9SS sorting signal type C domain-containing protein [Flavobacterium sp. 11]PIF61165.1 hypothetical protein CLV00_0725 [Flavobacterium sp. 11]